MPDPVSRRLFSAAAAAAVLGSASHRATADDK